MAEKASRPVTTTDIVAKAWYQAMYVYREENLFLWSKAVFRIETLSFTMTQN